MVSSIHGDQLDSLLQTALEAEQLSRQDHLKLSSSLLSFELSSTERAKINRIFDRIRSGRIRLID
ncbi:MAG: hypothetical protein F6J97_26395 [Leptolyngbya sp. SIO4C1]|nr:hypothetical protein [Leptolyngbya sp. SIO4C1]